MLAAEKERSAMRKSYLEKFSKLLAIFEDRKVVNLQRNNTTNLHATLNMHVLNRMCYKMFLFHSVLSWIQFSFILKEIDIVSSKTIYR